MSLRLWLRAAFVSAASAAELGGLVAETRYSQNALCRQNNCVNPLFPGLNDLMRLDAVQWQCASMSTLEPYIDFCAGAINYDPALPSPNTSAVYANVLVKAQDDAASTMFFYHLAGLGYDAWEFNEPSQSEDACVVATWKMICYTYFPKAEAGCKAGEPSKYKRPCMNSCHNYVAACQVECCDESVRCNFNHEVQTPAGGSYTQTGYVDQIGPSALCTGAASRTVAPSFWLLSFCLLVISCTLHGCDLSVPRHRVGNWRKRVDYLVTYQFVPPGSPGGKAVLNSCSTNSSETVQCNGHGYCHQWRKGMDSVQFCKCDQTWADPECRTRRKSQMVTFLLALLMGFLGADMFYLGYPIVGSLKLFAVGGTFGIWFVAEICSGQQTWASLRLLLGLTGAWWAYDAFRAGAGPIYAGKFRTASDLSHWTFLLTVIALAMLWGFAWGVSGYMDYRRQKREDYMMLKVKAEQHCSEPQGLAFKVPGRREHFDQPNGRGQCHPGQHHMGYGAAGGLGPDVPHPEAVAHACDGYFPAIDESEGIVGRRSMRLAPVVDDQFTKLP